MRPSWQSLVAAALADNSAAAEKIFEKYLKKYWQNIWKLFEILADNSTAAAAVKKYIFFKLLFFILFNSTAAAVKYHQKYSKHATAPWFEGVDDGHGWSIWYVEKTIE